MLYIKSYVSGNGKNLVIKEASEIECREYLVDINSLYKEWKNSKSPEGAEKLCFTQIFESALKDKAIINFNSKFANCYNFEEYGEKWKQATFNPFIVISFLDANEEKCYFVPCGSTYIVNEKGATIETVIKTYGTN